jgi:hypothetical protein
MKPIKQSLLIERLMKDSSVSDADFVDHLRSLVELRTQSLEILQNQLLDVRPTMQEEVTRLIAQHGRD